MLQRGTGLSLAVSALMAQPVAPGSMAFLQILLLLLKIVSGNHFDKAITRVLNKTTQQYLYLLKSRCFSWRQRYFYSHISGFGLDSNAEQKPDRLGDPKALPLNTKVSLRRDIFLIKSRGFGREIKLDYFDYNNHH